MERNDIINSFEYKVSKEAVKRAKDGIDIPSYEEGAEFAQKLIYSDVIKWLGHMFPADTYVGIITKFKKDFEL